MASAIGLRQVLPVHTKTKSRVAVRSMTSRSKKPSLSTSGAPRGKTRTTVEGAPKGATPASIANSTRSPIPDQALAKSTGAGSLDSFALVATRGTPAAATICRVTSRPGAR
jgi:hypothetical protein